jgi:MoxR-like ATPase
MFTNMTVSELRKECRNMNPPPATGVAISGANKDQLLAWLDGTSPAPQPVETTPYIETIPQPANFNGQASDYLANLQSALQPLIGNLETKQPLDENRIIELIKEHQPKARELVVKPVDMPVINIGIQHKQFEQLLKNANARVPSMLVGPSGSGKTHSAGQLAKALQLDYEAISCNPMTSKTDLLGYRDANGVYHDTALVRRFRDGGVLMLDEIDASNASVLTGINMATSNGEMATPEGMIEKHADFILVAGANTWGNGATPEFVGRNQLDLATKKRFFMLDWDYDESIELQISDATTPEEKELVEELQKYRATARNLELRVSITPRDSIYGVRLLRAGTDKKTILRGLVFADLDKSTISKIKG